MAKVRESTPVQTALNPVPPDYQLIAAWRATLRDFLATSKVILKRHGVTSMQYQTLLAIRISEEPEGMSMNALASHLGIRHNSAVGLINRLEVNGHVKRVRSQRDRRVAHLQITPTGEECLRELAEAHRQELTRIRPEMRRIFK
ncbi:MAG: MarR family winged helix-turn-helix transcriptional regulator [Bacillota bacterium]